MIGKLWRRLHYQLNRRRLERELAEEMLAHVAEMPAGRRGEFGSTLRLSEQSNDAWTWNWLEEFRQDLRYGARVLWRAPGFTLGAVAVLALGIGVNLAEYQVFDAMLFHRLTIRDADGAVQFGRASREGFRMGFPHAAVEFFREHSRSFAWLLSEDTSFNVTVENEGNLRSSLVSADHFAALGVAPAHGRLLHARDAQPGAPPVAVLGHEYWLNHWGGDQGVVGRVIHINNQPVQVVGVLPYNFEGLSLRRLDIWLPVTQRPALMAGSPPLPTDFARQSSAFFGMLKPGISQAAGEAELTSLLGELSRRQPGSFQERDRIQASPIQVSALQSIARNPATAIFIVMILLVLLSACANLGNMMLARGLARQWEIHIRVAIGASRARVVRQLMAESLLLALLGSVAGLAVGTGAARLLLTFMGAPPALRVPMRWPVPVAGFVLALLSAVAFGLPAALQTVRPAGHRKSRMRQVLVGVQVSVSCLLLIASSVLAHNGILSATIPLTFDYEKMVIINPVTPKNFDQIHARLAAVPGVEGVTSAVAPPLSGRLRMVTLPGLPHVYWNSVASSYFGVMNLPLVLGRTFEAGELNSVIVSESAARAIWPAENPIGKTWRFAGADRTVTGVAKDSGANLLVEQDSVEAYIPLSGGDLERSAFILRTRSDPAPLVRSIAAAPLAVGAPVLVVLMRTSRDRYIDTQKKMVALIGSIGLVATALAAAGMFALVAFAVAQRRRDIGIRMAIGATGRHVLGVLLTQNVRPTVVGLAAGAILAVLLSRLVRSQVVMPNRDAIDFIGFAAGITAFVLVAALATLSPAMRALRIDPSTTLREE